MQQNSYKYLLCKSMEICKFKGFLTFLALNKYIHSRISKMKVEIFYHSKTLSKTETSLDMTGLIMSQIRKCKSMIRFIENYLYELLVRVTLAYYIHYFNKNGRSTRIARFDLWHVGACQDYSDFKLLFLFYLYRTPVIFQHRKKVSGHRKMSSNKFFSYYFIIRRSKM